MSEEKKYSELRFAVAQIGEGADRRYRLIINQGMASIEWDADEFDKFWEACKAGFENGDLIYLPQGLLPKQ